MIAISKTEVFNFEAAIRGARNPMNSWDRIDSSVGINGDFIFGENDLNLAKKLCKAGSDHRKFMRQILVSVDIYAPLYWWKEFDTYKVGTTANSTSTMHKIHAKSFAVEDFSHDRLDEAGIDFLMNIISVLEEARLKFVSTNDKAQWYKMIQLLPSSYNQLRTCTMSYENLINMYNARKTHKLDEWHEFCRWVSSLPYAKDLICL